MSSSLLDELEGVFVKEICNELSSLLDDEFILKDYSERCQETHKEKEKSMERGIEEGNICNYGI